MRGRAPITGPRRPGSSRGSRGSYTPTPSLAEQLHGLTNLDLNPPRAPAGPVGAQGMHAVHFPPHCMYSLVLSQSRPSSHPARYRANRPSVGAPAARRKIVLDLRRRLRTNPRRRCRAPLPGEERASTPGSYCRPVIRPAAVPARRSTTLCATSTPARSRFLLRRPFPVPAPSAKGANNSWAR